MLTPRQTKSHQKIKEIMENAINKQNVDLFNFSKKLARIIKNKISTQKFCLFIYNPQIKKYTITLSTINKQIEILSTEYCVSVLKRENKIFLANKIPLFKKRVEGEEEKEHLTKVENKLQELNMELVIPLVAYEELVAIFFLGSKRNNKIYTTKDITFLTELADKASFCIWNMLVYKHALERLLQ